METLSKTAPEYAVINLRYSGLLTCYKQVKRETGYVHPERWLNLVLTTNLISQLLFWYLKNPENFHIWISIIFFKDNSNDYFFMFFLTIFKILL